MITKFKTPLTNLFSLLLASSIGAGTATAQNLAGDMALSTVLIDGENWEMVAEGHQFTDAACSDAQENFYFSDVSRGSKVFRIDTAGKISAFLTNAPKVSG